MTASVSDRVIDIASDLFGIPRESITSASSPESIEQWDSTQHLNFVLALEDAFQIQLSPEETERMRTIGLAAEVIQQKLKTVDA